MTHVPSKPKCGSKHPSTPYWDALTRAEELVRWFLLEAGENPDGSLWMSFGEGFRFEGRAAESDPPHRIRFVYPQPPPGRDPASLKPEDYAQIATEYVLESDGGMTLLRLVHSGFGTEAEWDDQFEATRTGAGRWSSVGSATISRTTAAAIASWPGRKRPSPRVARKPGTAS